MSPFWKKENQGYNIMWTPKPPYTLQTGAWNEQVDNEGSELGAPMGKMAELLSANMDITNVDI